MLVRAFWAKACGNIYNHSPEEESTHSLRSPWQKLSSLWALAAQNLICLPISPSQTPPAAYFSLSWKINVWNESRLRGVLEQTPLCGGSYCSHEPIFSEEQSYSIGKNLADVFWLWRWTWASRPWTSSLETWVFVGVALLGGSAHAGGSICQETKGCWKHLFKITSWLVFEMIIWGLHTVWPSLPLKGWTNHGRITVSTGWNPGVEGTWHKALKSYPSV